MVTDFTLNETFPIKNESLFLKHSDYQYCFILTLNNQQENFVEFFYFIDIILNSFTTLIGLAEKYKK